MSRRPRALARAAAGGARRAALRASRGEAGRRVLLGAYLTLGAADTVLAAAGVEGGVRWATKPLLMPVLGAYVVASAPRGAGLRLPLIALAGSCAGDAGLLTGDDTLFLAGMAGFAVAHVAYLRAFGRAGAVRRLRAAPWIPAGYAVAWAGALASLWDGLGDLRVPVAAYSLLLTAMAATAAGTDRRTAAGGALFLLSDTLIAMGLADTGDIPGRDALVMPTYLAAQLLLMSSWTRGAGRDAAATAPSGDAAAGTRPA